MIGCLRWGVGGGAVPGHSQSRDGGTFLETTLGPVLAPAQLFA